MKKVFSVLCMLIIVGTSSSCIPSEPQDDLTKLITVEPYVPGLQVVPIKPALSRILVDRIRPYFYVTDRAQNQVHIYNTNDYNKEASVPVGSNPTQMVINADSTKLFILLSGGSQIAVLDLITFAVLAPIDLPGAPHSMALGANDKLYVSFSDISALADTISIIDVSTYPAANVGELAQGTQSISIYILGSNSSGSRLYTWDILVGFTQWDISSVTPVAIQSVKMYDTIVISPDNTSILNFLDDGELAIHRTSDLLPDGTVGVEWRVAAAAVNHTGDRLAVAHSDRVANPTYAVSQRHNRNRPDIHLFDANTYIELRYYITAGYVPPHGITYGSDGRMYILLGDVTCCDARSVIASKIGIIEP